ncbi:unnamed protein product [Protopolystoma xenopodis]|uniref:Uncharacterized protein n=1 Tax=Protopolystoma xenopodis TaxID=117903 RepID=A0A3S5AA12_9PLAT|nr:unnamed protein product [Protopolystoma xenopodis]
MQGYASFNIAASHVYEGFHCSAGLIHSATRLNRVTLPNISPVRSPFILQRSQTTLTCRVESHRGDEASHRLPDGRRALVEVRSIRGACNEERRLLQTDIVALNGVIHIIEEPLVPLEGRFKNLP